MTKIDMEWIKVFGVTLLAVVVSVTLFTLTVVVLANNLVKLAIEKGWIG